MRLLQRCLQKDPRRRLQAIGDARLDIEEALTASPATMSATPTRWGTRVLGLLAVSGIVSSALLAVLMFRTRAAAPPVAVLSATITLPEGRYLDGVGQPELAVSKDGATLAFLAQGVSGLQELCVRPLNAARATLVPNSETAEGPFFSPDGRMGRVRGRLVDSVRRSARAAQILSGHGSDADRGADPRLLRWRVDEGRPPHFCRGAARWSLEGTGLAAARRRTSCRRFVLPARTWNAHSRGRTSCRESDRCW